MEKVNGVSDVCPFRSEEVDFRNSDNAKPIKPNLRIKVPQAKRLKNHSNGDEVNDNLLTQDVNKSDTQCTEKVCLLSVMGIPGRGNTPRTPDEVYADAEEFLNQYFVSVRRENSEAHIKRLAEVKNELSATGTYKLQSPELMYGCKMAWRNAPRCIGRIQWKKLRIFDCREVTTASGMFESLCTHIKFATNKGNIRSAITIFPQRTDDKHDYRIWNPQLISYAGYRQPDDSVIGDPMRVEFTDICIRLGWKPPGTAWDILPLVLQADGKDPEFFDIPREIIMEVELAHPEYKWFSELGMKWYALPAVSSMRFDCGGLEFTGTAFNGWYMSTEIGCRNLCDANRYNLTEIVATKMGLDTSTSATLWKDRALVEVNIAVLHSFMRDKVVIVDHHTASEQFIKHLDNENKSRAGCPSDWIWIVPPMSSSLTSVYHQEMAFYRLKPSYEYQEPAWKLYQWTKPSGTVTKRRFHFKQIARAVKFTSKLFGRALSKRVKATILYGSETGKSEQFAKQLGTIFSYGFNAHVQSMAEYDIFSIEHETLLIIVTSTSGNGDPPANGIEFYEHLCEMLYHEHTLNEQNTDGSAGSMKFGTPKSFMRSNSFATYNKDFKMQLSRLESYRSSVAGTSSAESLGPLSNVYFAVFALGSSAYPKFCKFGYSVDNLLQELGGERLLEIATGDELIMQEQQFRNWASNVFQASCEAFCLDNSEVVEEARKSFGTYHLSEETVRFWKAPDTLKPLKLSLESSLKKHLVVCTVKENTNLTPLSTDRATIFVDMEHRGDIKYEPGDHVGILACNRKELVDKILDRFEGIDDFDKPLQLQVLKETLTPTGIVKLWVPHESLPPVTIRELFTRFLDITTPPSTDVLKYLASTCTDEDEKEELNILALDSNKYDDWRHNNYPNLAEVLGTFPSARPQVSLLAAMLPILQARLYSISSSPLADSKRLHITVAVVVYTTQNGNVHYGVCSNYLQGAKPGDQLFVFIRRAPSFYLPKSLSTPIILVGPGTGIAPFRGFWRHRGHQMKNHQTNINLGSTWLFFGCRLAFCDVYKDEKELALMDGILTKNHLAISRDKTIEKKYVQDLIEDEGAGVSKMLFEQGGHFYVCGDCKMAEDVQQRLKGVLKKHIKMTDDEVENFILKLLDENRYHEDIFGITLRTAEVQSASREFARMRLESTKSEP